MSAEIRPWVARLGSYLRIFGRPAPGTMGYLTSPDYLDGLIRIAQKREQEFGEQAALNDGEDAQAAKGAGS